MRVTDVRMETYRWPGAAQMAGGRFIFAGEGLDVVRVETSEGLSGIGLSWSVGAVAEMGRSIVEHLGRSVVGHDPLDTERIWDAMWQTGDVGRRGLTTRMLSAVDTALWDIKGKVAGMPLYKLLGGFTSTVPAYVSRGFRTEGDSLEAVARTMEAALEEGARAVKMQIGGASVGQDVERVRVARETLGPEVKLMLDASCQYRFYEAIEIARKIEKYDIAWLEEPVRPDDYRGYQLVSQATSIPIAGGEGEYTKHGFRDLIEGRCVAIVQPDALIVGGITEWMKVAALAQAHDRPVSPHGPHHVHAHLVAAIPNGLNVEGVLRQPHRARTRRHLRGAAAGRGRARPTARSPRTGNQAERGGHRPVPDGVAGAATLALVDAEGMGVPRFRKVTGYAPRRFSPSSAAVL